jgi:hypothetical protein
MNPNRQIPITEVVSNEQIEVRRQAGKYIGRVLARAGDDYTHHELPILANHTGQSLPERTFEGTVPAGHSYIESSPQSSPAQDAKAA